MKLFYLQKDSEQEALFERQRREQAALLYAVAALRAIDVSFVRERGQTSLANRLNALERWELR